MSPRRLGQHFLTDHKLLDRIVEALDVRAGETVIEVGPGHGSLTEVLLDRGAQVIAIEKDRELAEQLRVRVSGVGCQVVTGDALKVDWHELYSRHLTPDTRHRLKIVGNIPYYITSPLIDKALTPPLPDRIVFLVQAEVADRIAAKPGGKIYGALSVGVQAVARVEKLFNVAAGAFRPPPRVRSTVIRLTPLVEPLVRPGRSAGVSGVCHDVLQQAPQAAKKRRAGAERGGSESAGLRSPSAPGAPSGRCVRSALPARGRDTCVAVTYP
ncbi:MAG: ribosomal RNA small subunit methyltransferase A [Gemmatimonadetes bacterium]|nr:MAG: ribosomal RNA small subunit methyltransferase A [Gemmatimonadota bacterium]